VAISFIDGGNLVYPKKITNLSQVTDKQNNNWEDLENESFPLHDKGNSRLMAFGHQGVASFRHLELTNFKRDAHSPYLAKCLKTVRK
jgi:hypothetical protein